VHTYKDGLSGSVARDGWSGSTPDSTCSCPCEMFSSVGGATVGTSPEEAYRSALSSARTDGCGRLTTRRLAAGNPEMASAEGSTSASRRPSAAGSSDAAGASSSSPAAPALSPAAPWTAAASSSAESESEEWSAAAAAAAEVEGLDGDASGLRFRLRHLRRESGRVRVTEAEASVRSGGREFKGFREGDGRTDLRSTRPYEASSAAEDDEARESDGGVDGSRNESTRKEEGKQVYGLCSSQLVGTWIVHIAARSSRRLDVHGSCI